MSSAPADGSRRLFLALWPDPGVRRQLAAIARAVPGGRRVKETNLHLTLVFLGTTDTERQRCYAAALERIAVPRLELTLDRLGCWPKPGVLWLGPGHVPRELPALVDDLNQSLAACGFQPERRAFRAHVTLARDFRGPTPTLSDIGPPVHWQTDRIALVESRTSAAGSQYTVLRYRPDSNGAAEPLQ